MSSIKSNEQILLASLANGDENAFAEIYKLHWQSLFVSAYNVTRDKGACNDILQDIFLQLWLRREKIAITGSLEAYLHTAVRYQVFKYIRKSTRVSHLFEQLDQRLSETPADGQVIFKELNEQVTNAVESLPSQCMLIYKLSREQQLSNREIAEQLNISIKTVENQMTIALRRLRVSLNDAAFSIAVISCINLSSL
jgi:RNA polymerase sigma-70 factor (family 1)